MTKHSSVLWAIPLFLLFLLLQGVSTALSGAENELIYKPKPAPVTYNLRVTTHSELETSQPRSDVTADHEDILTLSQRITQAEGGLLNVALTFDSINSPPPARAAEESGHHYRREDVVGNTQRTVISVLGEVKEATGLPHFSSRNYNGARGIDGVTFDMCRVILMLYPQFPHRPVGTGDRWTVEDQVAVGAADVSVAGLGVLGHHFAVDVDRKITYRLLGFPERKGYRTAHIAFQAQYDLEGNSSVGAEDFFSEGSGEDEGEIYFAPEAGIVVEASINSRPVETKRQGGEMVRVWLNPQTNVFLTLRGEKTTPLKWRSEKRISFELAERR